MMIKGALIMRIRTGRENLDSAEMSMETPVTPPSIKWLGSRNPFNPSPAERMPTTRNIPLPIFRKKSFISQLRAFPLPLNVRRENIKGQNFRLFLDAASKVVHTHESFGLPYGDEGVARVNHRIARGIEHPLTIAAMDSDDNDVQLGKNIREAQLMPCI